MAQPELHSVPEADSPSLGSALKELAATTRELVESEMDLARAEFNSAIEKLGKYSVLAALSGVILALSLFPFLAFLVIGLGRLLNDNYWLSSIIVSVAFAAIGAPLAFRYLHKIKSQRDLSLPRTRRSLEREKNVVMNKVQDIKDSVQNKMNQEKTWRTS